MKRSLIAWFVLLSLCMGQSCSLPAGDTGDTGDDSSDTGDDPGDSERGIPEGVYTGKQGIFHSLDNLSDLYPPETADSEITARAEFNEDGLLLWPDRRLVKVNDVEYSDTQLGRVYETITSIATSTKQYQYRTVAEMVMQDSVGQVWTFTGSGLYTYRLAGGQVLYEGELTLTSDEVGGASYKAVWELDATLIE